VRSLVGLLFLSGALSTACTAATSSTPDVTTMTTTTAADLARPAAVTDAGTATTTTSHWFSRPAGPDDLALVYTASVQGYVEPCGCTGDPLGGIARLGALLSEARSVYGDRVLFVDGGDLLFEKPDDHAAADRCQAEARTELLVGTYARLGLAATTRGPLDEVRGAPFRTALLQQHDVPSLDDGEGLVVVRGGRRVLVIGADAETAPDDVQKTIDAHGRDDATPVDLVVVLLQARHAQAKVLAARWRGVDVVVVGRAAEGPMPPERAGDAVVVSAGWQAQRVGVVVARLQGRTRAGTGWTPLGLDDRAVTAAARRQVLDVRIEALEERLATLPPGDTRVFQQQRRDAFVAERAALDVVDATSLPGPHVEVLALPLRRGAPEEPAAAQALQAYLRSIPTLVGACERDVVCPAPPADVATYVGGAVCRACHAAAYAHWQQAVVDLDGTNHDGSHAPRPVGHALAWQTLVHVGRDRDRACVGCHSVGFGAAGGACTTTQLVERGLTDVQCESCHGPGSQHVQGAGDKTKIRRDVDEATCRGCHVPPHIETVESFVFSDRLRIILGEGHGAARLHSLPPPERAPAPAGASR
jgi:hypothetical protein